MARIRTIKPEFPQSESMGRVSRDARLLFMMLWTICDDHGRARAHSRMLASLLFPYDDDAGEGVPIWLDELEKEGCIKVYEVEGSTYLQIVKWSKHQKIDKPSKPQFPAPSEGTREDYRDSREHSSEEGTKEGRGRDKDKSPIGDSSPAAEKPAAEDFTLTDPLDGEAGQSGTPPCPVQRIIASYHRHLPELPSVRAFPDSAKKMLVTRWREEPERQTLEWWDGFFAYVAGCPFLVGARTDFTADLIWLVRPSNFAKVVNGNYEVKAVANG